MPRVDPLTLGSRCRFGVGLGGVGFVQEAFGILVQVVQESQTEVLLLPRPRELPVGGDKPVQHVTLQPGQLRLGDTLLVVQASQDLAEIIYPRLQGGIIHCQLGRL